MIRWHRRGDQPVDTHVLIYHSRKRPEWLDQCLASLEHEPTNVVLVDDPSDNVGYVRAIASREGNAPLLSFVDDDDWVMPGAFAACIDAIDADPQLVGAYTDFSDVDCETGKLLSRYVKRPWNPRTQLQKPFEVLHVHVYRRAPAMKYLDEMAKWKTLEESILMGLLVQDGDWRKIDFDGYRKRLHSMGAGSRVTPELVRNLTMQLSPILLRHPAGLPIGRAASAVVRSIDRADAAGRGCVGCKAARRAARKIVTRFTR